MNIFLDTCALFKLYHEEPFSSELKQYLQEQDGISLIISWLAKVEFASAVWKKVRSNTGFTEEKALALLQLFENDMDNFFIVDFDKDDDTFAKRLLNRCNSNGVFLRTLDALQLTSAMKLSDVMDKFITFDDKLESAASAENLNVKIFVASGGVED
ncbi:MAG: type II toxin-antitoxin system VapC family toxin [Chitinophagaceae bacterium]